jgi:hypothetical protein
MMPALPDIVVDSPTRRQILYVECKTTKTSDTQEAARMRRNCLMHSLVSSDAYFMVALPNTLFLWNQNSAAEMLPSFTADAKPVLRDYLGKKIVDREGGPRGESLELAIAAWLGDLAAGVRSPGQSAADQILVSSGLYEAMKGGRVSTEPRL